MPTPRKKPEDLLKAGRKPIYGLEIIKKAEKYLASCVDEDIQLTVGLSSKGTELFKNKKIVKMPSKGGLATYLGVSRETLYDWASKFPRFSDIMDKLGAIQEERLLNNGLSGDYNPTIAKVLLTKHGYRDAVDSDVTSGGEKIESVQFIFPE